jgi:hypothetical protein
MNLCQMGMTRRALMCVILALFSPTDKRDGSSPYAARLIVRPFIRMPNDPSASRQPVRRFSLLDVMVMIAATAIGLAFDRVVWLGTPLWNGTNPMTSRDLTLRAIALSVPVAAIWTIATVLLHLRHLRYPLRRMLRRPGMAASCAATVALVLGGGLAACTMEGASVGLEGALVFGCGLPVMAGSAVAAVWTLSMMVGRYRPVADWLDRLGRLMGLYWVLSFPALGCALSG